MADLAPEVGFAQRLIERRSLVPPIDVLSILREYAEVRRVPIPFDVDGLCIGLKVPGTRPRVFVNDNRPDVRVRFTLAHELGHIIIPWHIGDIVDHTSTNLEADFEYRTIEAEANRFASELLMPTKWVEELACNSASPELIVKAVRDQARVSLPAATFKAVQCLSPNYVFAQMEGGVVVSSGRSPGTVANPPARGSIPASDLFPYASNTWRYGGGGTVYKWWFLGASHAPSSADASHDWRKVLDEIVLSIGVPEDYAKKFKERLNGTISGANNSARYDRTAVAIYSNCIQRLHARGLDDIWFAAFYSHPMRDEFLALRIAQFIE